MINSKQKGARFERWIAKYFRSLGYDTRRTAQYCGNTGEAADVIGLDGLHIEAKHQETMHLYDWMEQAKRDCRRSNNLPVVMHKKNNHSVLVTMELDDWVILYREWEHSLRILED